MAFSVALLYLLQKRLETPILPDLALLRKLNEEAIFLGFCLFTLCMVMGSIWAQVAWGYYFSWNIKSVWSSIVWLFYGGCVMPNLSVAGKEPATPGSPSPALRSSSLPISASAY